MVFNLSEEEPSWNICLPSLLHCHSFTCNFTPFKSVSDIVLLGTKWGPYFDPCADHWPYWTSHAVELSLSISIFLNMDLAKMYIFVLCCVVLPLFAVYSLWLTSFYWEGNVLSLFWRMCWQYWTLHTVELSLSILIFLKMDLAKMYIFLLYCIVLPLLAFYILQGCDWHPSNRMETCCPYFFFTHALTIDNIEVCMLLNRHCQFWSFWIWTLLKCTSSYFVLLSSLCLQFYILQGCDWHPSIRMERCCPFFFLPTHWPLTILKFACCWTFIVNFDLSEYGPCQNVHLPTLFCCPPLLAILHRSRVWLTSF